MFIFGKFNPVWFIELLVYNQNRETYIDNARL